MELTNDLLQNLLALPRKDRETICRKLGASLADPRSVRAVYGLDEMVAAMQRLTGLDPKARTRERSVVRSRTVLCYVCHEKGLSLQETARFFGLNHCTVIYANRKMASALNIPTLYPDYIQLYNQFKKAIS